MPPSMRPRALLVLSLAVVNLACDQFQPPEQRTGYVPRSDCDSGGADEQVVTLRDGREGDKDA